MNEKEFTTNNNKSHRNVLQVSKSIDTSDLAHLVTRRRHLTANNDDEETQIDLGRFILEGKSYSYNSLSGKEEKEIQTMSNKNANSSVENFCWLLAAIISIYFSDIFNVLLNDSRVYR